MTTNPEPLSPDTLPAYTAGGLPLPDAADLIADTTFTARFWAKVAKSEEPDSCWLWTAATEEKGYGRFRVCCGLMYQAHRVAYMLDRGYWPHSDRMILHSCDTPACCNPNHLREGTAADNNQETSAKGRNRWGRAGREYWREGKPSENILRGSSKLSEWDVREIRREAGEGIAAATLAAKYNVSVSTIRDCVRRRTFAWVVGGG